MPAEKYTAFHAALLVPWLESARGWAITAPVKIIDNATLLTINGRIVAIGTNLRLPVNCEIIDFGDATLAPAFVNCHAHLQLSWLKGATIWGEDFTAWLKSLVPHILDYVKNGPPPGFETAIAEACANLAAYGTGVIADTGGSLPGALSKVDYHAVRNGLLIQHFCEWFGFGAPDVSLWPERCVAEIDNNPELAQKCSPCGHALYSTSPEILVRAHRSAKSLGRKFSFHLGESEAEAALLLDGSGPLAQYYHGVVLPENWQPPGLSPFRYAQKLGLLDSATLAVHGVFLEKDEIADFSATGAALCLCPRSNVNLGSGLPPIKELLDSDTLLCLGTDGLTSCPDLNLRNEAAFLVENLDLPLQALLRLAIANGGEALGIRPPELAPGRPARFSLWQAI